MEFVPVKDWNPVFNARPLVIAGPCSAETQEQVMETALLLQGSAHLYRAGIWKPRTRPGTFEGAGEAGLQWLSELKSQTGMAVTIEVAQPRHVELALRYGIDVLWIGARTTVNPFLVQELASALSGIDIPVMVKNPVNPDLALWLGAIERIYKAGIAKIAAIHRGFSSFENNTYRNKPNWEIPIELKRRLPELPLICDPSHISGKTYMIPYISQFAMDLQYDGLMIESHVHPASALSDAEQQLTPSALKELLEALVIRNASVDNSIALSKLEDLRDQIDELDDEIVSRLAERMRIARLIGEYKYHNNIAVLQPERWQEIVRSRTASGVSKQLTKKFILDLYSIIHHESIFQQMQQMDAEKKIEGQKHH